METEGMHRLAGTAAGCHRDCAQCEAGIGPLGVVGLSALSAALAGLAAHTAGLSGLPVMAAICPGGGVLTLVMLAGLSAFERP